MFIQGGFDPKSNPLPFIYLFFYEKVTPFVYLLLANGTWPFTYLAQNFASLLTAGNHCLLNRNQSQK